MQIFDGKFHSILLEEQIAKHIGENGRPEGVLLIVQVGSDPSSQKYISLKLKLCEKFGLKTRYSLLSSTSSDEELYRSVANEFGSPEVRGGIIQLPLPRVSLKGLLDLVPVEKDLDLLSSRARDDYDKGENLFVPPVVRSLQYFIEASGSLILEKSDNSFPVMKAAVIGHGMLVGQPAATHLKNIGFEVDIINDYKRGKKLDYQLVVLSAGVPGLVSGEDLLPGSHIIDYGSSVVDGKVVGDLDLSSPMDHLGVVSMSPGGVGPLVVRFLIMNFLGI
jgi:methylenetetrahydrofolate dehydrogenase (NADP+) / methenyltetrahydrofolate cyclohydrolase